MELEVWERLRLLESLPERGDFVTLRIVRKLREDLSFSEEEIAALEFKKDGNRLMWKPNVELHREFQFGPKAKSVIEDALKALDRSEGLDGQTMALFEKFVDTTKYDLGGEAG
jgi:hypothetical protein